MGETAMYNSEVELVVSAAAVSLARGNLAGLMKAGEPGRQTIRSRHHPSGVLKRPSIGLNDFPRQAARRLNFPSHALHQPMSPFVKVLTTPPRLPVVTLAPTLARLTIS